MLMTIPAILWGALAMLAMIAFYGALAYLVFLLIKALRTYIKVNEGTAQSISLRKPLGEAIKAQRNACGMTQEFVARELGVSRQAVSKWESGASEPNTTNLIALAKLFGVEPEDLLRSCMK